MSFAIPNLNNANLLNSAKQSVDEFTRIYPLVSIVAAVALSILAFNTLAAGTFTGLLVGSVFTFVAFTISNYMISHREEFSTLIRYSVRSLKTSNFDVRQSIERQAQIIRDRIAQRNI